ncbi:hypothetical protein [Streptomyces sp. NPDC046979]|uniref:hypothetical protein n=1 Tax=Streptomyces sp. NPDC046979 TaxID=3154604 RepID=UPI0033FB7185
MATAENQDLFDIYQRADVSPYELNRPSEVGRLSFQTPLDSKITCTVMELAKFAERVKAEAVAKALEGETVTIDGKTQILVPESSLQES